MRTAEVYWLFFFFFFFLPFFNIRRRLVSCFVFWPRSTAYYLFWQAFMVHPFNMCNLLMGCKTWHGFNSWIILYELSLFFFLSFFFSSHYTFLGWKQTASYETKIQSSWWHLIVFLSHSCYFNNFGKLAMAMAMLFATNSTKSSFVLCMYTCVFACIYALCTNST